jgi:hypothetical protein
MSISGSSVGKLLQYVKVSIGLLIPYFPFLWPVSSSSKYAILTPIAP